MSEDNLGVHSSLSRLQHFETLPSRTQDASSNLPSLLAAASTIITATDIPPRSSSSSNKHTSASREKKRTSPSTKPANRADKSRRSTGVGGGGLLDGYIYEEEEEKEEELAPELLDGMDDGLPGMVFLVERKRREETSREKRDKPLSPDNGLPFRNWFRPVIHDIGRSSLRGTMCAPRIHALPVDHHLLVALVAPRGLFVPENDIDWLASPSTTVCLRAGRAVYAGLGVKRNTELAVRGDHQHCQLPESGESEWLAFIDKFLLGKGEAVDVDVSAARVVSSTDWMARCAAPNLTLSSP